MSLSDPLSRACRLGAGLALLGALGGLQGCATAQNRDPMESWNRKVFSFNETLDDNVLKPVAKGYNDITPEPIRIGVRNFFGNIGDVWSTANLFFQGRFKDGTLGIIRVSINSTLGLAGLIDLATPMQLERPNEDFGQTLGVWGVKPGAYIVWPLLGPSTLRDSAGLPLDFQFSASSLVANTPRQANQMRVLSVVSLRAALLGASNLIDDVALDKYAFFRDAYFQRRQNLIYEGNPPEDDESSSYEPYVPDPEDTPASPPAAAPSAPAVPASAASGV